MARSFLALVMGLAACGGNVAVERAGAPVVPPAAASSSSTTEKPVAAAPSSDAGVGEAGTATLEDALTRDKRLCVVVRRAGATLLRYRSGDRIVTVETGNVQRLVAGPGADQLERLVGAISQARSDSRSRALGAADRRGLVLLGSAPAPAVRGRAHDGPVRGGP